MHSVHSQSDLITQDGVVIAIEHNDDYSSCRVRIDNISTYFRGYFIDSKYILFNLKSTLAQLGITSSLETIDLSQKNSSKEFQVRLISYGKLAHSFRHKICEGMAIGKLFAQDPARVVYDIDYLKRMLSRNDSHNNPLLKLSDSLTSHHIRFEKIEGRVVAFIPIHKSTVSYTSDISYYLSILPMLLSKGNTQTRSILSLFQKEVVCDCVTAKPSDVLLVKTDPLHIRSVFAKVVDEQLPKGVHHTSASLLQPDTFASGDIYELYSTSEEVVTHIPLEFYTLEPYKEYAPLTERNTLISILKSSAAIFNVFKSAPKSENTNAALFVVKGKQIENIISESWHTTSINNETPTCLNSFISQQAEHYYLQHIENDVITSEGVLFTKYFPSPFLKPYLLSQRALSTIKSIYFSVPSKKNGEFFTPTDRSLLYDLTTHGIDIYWADSSVSLVLKFCLKPGKTSGMFVPLSKVTEFENATMIGVYGSNLVEGDFSHQLFLLLSKLKLSKETFTHPLMNKDVSLALVTGGGPGAMCVGNLVATQVGILSCAHVVDFSTSRNKGALSEQKTNPYIEAKMTYSLEYLIERQAEFHLDLPIFVVGGIGTDFELCLEEVRRKVGTTEATPILLFGPKEYWECKITSRFKINKQSGTTKGSTWISNCFICVETADEGYSVYCKFFANSLRIGKEEKEYSRGFRLFSET